MSSPTFDAWLFNGRSAQGGEVHVTVHGQKLVLRSKINGVARTVPARRMRLSEPLLHAPRVVWLPKGFTLEVPDGAGFTRALEDEGWTESLAVRLGQRWPLSLAALVLTAVLLVVLYRTVLPMAAHWAAEATPLALEKQIGVEVLALLDAGRLQASRLDEERRDEIARRFAEAVARLEEEVSCELEFRSMPGPGDFNAFALPGGTIVLLDGLVRLIRNDDQVLGVLGHELGHAVHRHTLRHIAEVIGLSAVTQLLWGEISGVVAQIPTAIGFFSYSRDAEREADEFAVAFLRRNGLGAEPLHDFFLAVQALETVGRVGMRPPDFLSTHPSTEERLEWLRQQVEAEKR